MIAKCLYATGKDLGEPVRETMQNVETVYDLKVGEDYPVFGLSIFEFGLDAFVTEFSVLVCQEDGDPYWLPAGLFEIRDQPIPPNWEFSLLNGKAASGMEHTHGDVALWGYPLLVRDSEHRDGLLERDPDALLTLHREALKQTAGESWPGNRLGGGIRH